MSRRGLISVVLAGLLMVPGPLLVWLVGDRPGTPVQLQAPPATSGWQGGAAEGPWQPLYNHADSRLHQQLMPAEGELPVQLFVAAYNQQRQGAELDHVANRIAGRWTVVSDRRAGPVRKVTALAPGAQAWRIHYWYEIAGQRATSRLYAKLLTLWGRLQGQQAAAVLALASPCGDSAYRRDCAAADARLQAVQERMHGHLKLPMLGAARSAGQMTPGGLAAAGPRTTATGPEEAAEGAHQ